MTRLARHITRRLSHRRRGAVGLEAVLLVPPMLILFGAVSQTMILAQSRMYVEQAAYAVARSALVHKCPPENIVDKLQTDAPGLLGASCTETATDRRKWQDAGRWALVPAASPAPVMSQNSGCPQITAGREIVIGAQKLNGLDAAVAAKICYAYAPANTRISTAWVSRPSDSEERNIRWTMSATVEFRYPLSTPFRRFLGTKASDGNYYRWGKATVELM